MGGKTQKAEYRCFGCGARGKSADSEWHNPSCKTWKWEPVAVVPLLEYESLLRDHATLEALRSAGESRP